MKITELMEKNVHTCLPNDSLEDAAGTMLKEDIGALPVVDASNKLVGMITDRDICMSSLIEGQSLKDLPVSLAASTPGWCCSPGQSLDDIRATMETHKVHRVPIVDKEQKLVGIVGLGDVVRATSDKKSGMTPTNLSHALAAILEPRDDTAPVKASQSAKSKGRA